MLIKTCFWRISFPPDDWTPHDPEITADTF
jgi:hypothetical protein